MSGVAALLVSLGVRGPAAIDRIKATARDAGPAGSDPMYGVGVVDAQAAVAGLGGSGGAAGGGASGSATTGKVTMARSLKISTVRRTESAPVAPAADGKCTVTLVRGKKTVARGSVKATKGQTVKFALRFTKTGKALLRRGRAFRTNGTLAAAGVDTQRTKIAFRR